MSDGVSFKISVDDSRIRAALMGLIALGQDLSPVMRDLAVYGENSTKRRFEFGIGPDGTPWKKSLRAQLTGGKTLVEHRVLVGSIQPESGRDWAAWGSNVKYARIHQLGGEAGRRSHRVQIVARPYLGVNADDEAEMLAIIQLKLRGALHAG